MALGKLAKVEHYNFFAVGSEKAKHSMAHAWNCLLFQALPSKAIHMTFASPLKDDAKTMLDLTRTSDAIAAGTGPRDSSHLLPKEPRIHAETDKHAKLFGMPALSVVTNPMD
jgi:hypothetical protein